MSTRKTGVVPMDPSMASSPLRRTLPPIKVVPPPGAPTAPVMPQGEFRSDLIRRFERASPQTPPGPSMSVGSPWGSSAAPLHHELPPLRAASLSMARSSRAGFQVNANCSWETDAFASAIDYPRQSPPSQERVPPHRRQRPSGAASWEPLDDGLGAFYEVERLKRQVARLTEMGNERENCIEELVADSGSMQKRHEMELAQQREQDASDISANLQAMLEAQDRQHDYNTEMALSQQAAKYEAQLADARTQFQAQFEEHSRQQEMSIVSSKHLAEERSRTEVVERELEQKNSDIADLRAQMSQHSSELREQRRDQHLAAVRESMECWQQTVFRSWAAAAANVRYATKLEAELSHDTLQLRSQLRDRTGLVVEERCTRGRQAALRAWYSVALARKCEALHRRRVIDVSAESAAECYALRAEAKKQAADLRKQRRVHGVSAVHANLDHHMHAVLWAWSQQAIEAQREATHQKQLDILSVEAAAECAKIRMETHRRKAVLQNQRLKHAQAAIWAHTDLIRHLTLRAWAKCAEDERRTRAFHREVQAHRKAASAFHEDSNVEQGVNDPLKYQQRLLRLLQAKSRDADYATQTLVLFAWASAVSACVRRLSTSHLKLDVMPLQLSPFNSSYGRNREHAELPGVYQEHLSDPSHYSENVEDSADMLESNG